MKIPDANFGQMDTNLPKEENKQSLISKRKRDVTRRACPYIDRRLLWLKLVNLFFWGGTAFLRPYVVNWLHFLGLSTQETAVIVGTVPLAGMVTGPVVGMLADKYKAHRRLLTACLCCWIGGFHGMTYITPRKTYFMALNETNFTQSLGEVDQTSGLFLDSAFFFSLVSYLVIEASFPPSIALADTLVFAALGPARRSAYGRQRLFGTLGFMSFSLLGGVAFNHMDGVGESFHYRVIAASISVIFTFLSLIWVPSVREAEASAQESDEDTDSSSLPSQMEETEKLNPNCDVTLPIQHDTTAAYNKPDTSTGYRRFARLVTVPTTLLVASILIFGTLHGFWGTYYLVFLEKIIGASQSQMGATYAVATLAETGAMFTSGYFHAKLGYQKCLVLVYLGFAIRLGSYYFLSTRWLSLLIDALHALTFGLMWSTAASFANAIAPPDCVATLQAVISGICNSLGRAVGSSLGGVVIHHFGYRLAFLSGAIMALGFGVLFSLAVIGLSLRNKNATDRDV